MSLLAGGASLIGGLAGLFGNSGNSIPQYNPTFGGPQLQGTVNNANAAIGGVNQFLPYSGAVPNQILNQLGPQFGGIAQNIGNNRFVQQDINSQVQAQGYANPLANLQWGTGLNLTGQGLSQIPYLQQTLQTAFDPQNALYNRTLAQVQNQQNVQNAQSGVANTPYGASLADLNLQNFNIDWQNNLLSRMGAGAQTAGQLGSNISGLTGSGLQFAGAAPGTISALGQLPYSTYVGQQQNTTGALQNEQNALLGAQSSAANAINAYNTPFNDYIALLGGMTGANNAYTSGYNSQLGAQQQQFAQNQTFGNQIGAGLYGIGKGFSGFNFGAPLGMFG